jgi:hypothetical protein
MSTGSEFGSVPSDGNAPGCREIVRRIDRSGELVVEEAAAVIEPLRIGILGVGYLLGQQAAVGDGKNMQHGIFAAVLRQAVDHVTAVGRCAPPVERHMARGAAGQGGVDQHAVGPARALAHVELEIVGALGPLREEDQAAGALHAAGCHRVAGQLLNAFEQGCARRQLVEYGAGMVVLSLQEGQPLGVLVVLHPAVGVAQGFTEVGVADHGDARHGRRGGAGGGAGGGLVAGAGVASRALGSSVTTRRRCCRRGTAGGRIQSS